MRKNRIVVVALVMLTSGCKQDRKEPDNLGPRYGEVGTDRLSLVDAMRSAQDRRMGNQGRPTPSNVPVTTADMPYSGMPVPTDLGTGMPGDQNQGQELHDDMNEVSDDLSLIIRPKEVREMTSSVGTLPTRSFPDQMICRAVTAIFTGSPPSDIGQEQKSDGFDMKYRTQNGGDAYAKCIIYPDHASHLALMYFWQPQGVWSARQLGVYVDAGSELKVARWDRQRTYTAAFTREQFVVR